MNQSTGKSNAEEGQNDRIESLKDSDCNKQSNESEEPTTADRKEILKNDKVTNRKDESKTIPKLADDKLKKSSQSKLVPTNTTKTSNLPTSQKTTTSRGPLTSNSKTARTSVGSKIPSFKQMPNGGSSPKNKNNNTLFNAQQSQSKAELRRSDSKLSKVKPSVSKSSCTTTISNSAKVKDELKTQTARSHVSPPAPSITKRSASNMSSRSTPPIVKRDETRTNLHKMTSIAGDHSNVNNMDKRIINSRNASPTKKLQLETNLRQMLSNSGDQNKVDCLEKKLENAQTEFLLEIENLQENLPENLKSEYRLITVQRNDECKLMVKNDVLPRTFPVDFVQFKEKLEKCMEKYFASVFDDLKDTNESTGLNVETIKDKLLKLQNSKSNDILSFIDDLILSRDDGCDAQIVIMQKELQDSKKILKKLDKNITDLNRQHEEELLHLEKELKAKADADLSKKDSEMKDLNKKLKLLERQNDNLKTSLQNLEKEDKVEKLNLQEEIKTSRESYVSLQKKLHTVEQQLMSEKKDLKVKNEIIKKLENDLEEKKKLEIQLADITIKLQEVKDKPKTSNSCTEHQQQITELQNVVSDLENEKHTMEKKTEMLEAQVANLCVVQSKLIDAENCIQDLRRQLEIKEQSQYNEPDYAKDVQIEFAKFRQSDAEKRREIEKLKIELSKFQYNMCQLEEEIQRGHQLLEVRCELINSLQTNEKTQRIHMEELFAQIAEKNSTINDLNSDLRTKSEEFQNLFSTISAKQMELSNQEHMIKLLEDSNERSQMLRVKQEEKIGRMEDELAHLKQTIAVYQANILSGKHGKNVLYAPILPANSGDFNENFYYYASQRRRKRQVDINVKKYEA